MKTYEEWLNGLQNEEPLIDLVYKYILEASNQSFAKKDKKLLATGQKISAALNIPRSVVRSTTTKLIESGMIGYLDHVSAERSNTKYFYAIKGK